MAGPTAIGLEYYERCITVPIGNQLPDGVNMDDDVEIIIKGKVKSLSAAQKKGEHYKGDPGRPAELKVEIKSVTFEGTTNTFTKLARDFGEDY